MIHYFAEHEYPDLQRTVACPKCDADITDNYIHGVWYCPACDHEVPAPNEDPT